LAGNTRNSRIPKRDGRNRITVKVGGREDYRVFRFSDSVSPKEVQARVARLKEVYSVCGGWNELSNFIAGALRKGDVPVPLPPKDLTEILGVEYNGWVSWRAVLVSKLPSIPWATLGESTVSPAILGAIRQLKAAELNEAAAVIAGIDGRPVSVAKPIPGSLYEALDGYAKYAEATDGRNHDRHTKIRQLKQRHADQPLATLGLDACRNLIDYWRQRPNRHDGGGQYTEKRSREQLAELDRFFEWMHLSDQFQWREPEDFHRLDRTIIKDGSSRKSILESKMPVFGMNDLASLVRNADMPEKLWIVWCLNNSHGAAEVGRVQWEDIYLDQDHPWRKEGLKVWEGGNWVGFLRPKTDVLGWWMLWPETVELLLQWKARCQKMLHREVGEKDPIIIRTTGQPLYNDDSKNGQSGFYNHFDRLKKKCKRLGFPVADLPPGTLRNQFSDWCGGEEADATVAGVALAHGIPHRGDKLLYKHYSNRPWRRLFEKQQEFRDYCRPVLDAITEEPALPPKVRELKKIWSGLTGSKLQKIRAAAQKLNVSTTSVYRYLEKIDGLHVS